MKKDEAEKLLAELEEAWPIVDIITFNELTLSDKVQQEWPYQLTRFSDQLLLEKNKLNGIQEIRDKVVGEAYDDLRFNGDRQLDKKEIETYYLPREPKVVKVNRAINRQKFIIEFFENCVKALEKIQWHAKLFHDDRKYSG